MENAKRAWIYARVAAPPTEGPAPLEMQKEGLYDLAARHGYTVVGCSGEYAGGLTLERVGIQEVFLAAEKGLFDVLLAKDVARITCNYVDWSHIENTFGKLGIALHTADSGYVEPRVNGSIQQHETEHENTMDDLDMDSQQM